MSHIIHSDFFGEGSFVRKHQKKYWKKRKGQFDLALKGVMLPSLFQVKNTLCVISNPKKSQRIRSKLHLSEMSAKIISSWITPVPLISVKECQDMISTGQKPLMNKFPIWPLNPDMPLFSPKSIFPKDDFSCWIGCTNENKKSAPLFL